MTQDGGPAFPFTEANGANSGDVGMSLRDYFAIRATEDDIQRHLPTGRTVDQIVSDGGMEYVTHRTEYRTREEARYAFADAMLAARKA